MQKWSLLPKIFTFLFLSILVIYSYEFLRFSNKDLILNERINSVLGFTERFTKENSANKDPSTLLSNQLSTIRQKSKEEKKHKMLQILIDGAQNQELNDETQYKSEIIDNFYDI